MKVLKYLAVIIISLFIYTSVDASTNFTVARCSEKNYIRESAGSNNLLKDVDGATILLPADHLVEVTDTTTYGGKKWYKVKTNYYSNNYVGWIYSGYFKDVKSYNTNDDYKNNLVNSGFPEDYALSLAKLHEIHPNWQFIVSKYHDTGLDWNTILDNETVPASKNLIQNTSNKSLWSTDSSVYSNGNYTTFENYWHAASRQTVAFYLDPRNWLYEPTMFMFQKLDSTGQTLEDVQNILKGTFMQGNYTYNGRIISYAETFYEVANQLNVSATQLASRVVQEQGTRGSATINMKYNGKTYYNFFNINATGSDIVGNALRIAVQNNWDNPYSSIKGGATQIANGYSAVGQDTLYYQKFNTISDKYGLYENQYMTNVRPLPAESYSTYNSYKSNNKLDASYTFKIPVYLNMPSATSLGVADNGDTNLKSLSITNCNLNPSFSSNGTSYTCNVDSSVNSVSVNAKASSDYANVKGNGNYNLTGDTTDITISVTAANGNTKNYAIKVVKVNPIDNATPNDIISYLGYSNSNNVLSGVVLNTTASNVLANINGAFPISSATIKDASGKAKTGALATGDTLAITYNNKTITYTIKIKGDVSGDGAIDISDLALVKGSMLGRNKLSDIKRQSADINGDGVVDISDLAMIKGHMLGRIQITK